MKHGDFDNGWKDEQMVMAFHVIDKCQKEFAKLGEPGNPIDTEHLDVIVFGESVQYDPTEDYNKYQSTHAI